MRFEATLPRVGELRASDLRKVFGEEVWNKHHVDVLVLGAPAELPAAARVLLDRLRQGRGQHLAVRCPGCARAVLALRVIAGALRCAQCGSRLTRQQSEKETREWQLGGRQEDELNRLLSRQGTRTDSGRAHARGLARGLLQMDSDRVCTVAALAARALAAEES